VLDLRISGRQRLKSVKIFTPRTHYSQDSQYYPSALIFRTGFNFLLHHALSHLEIPSIEGHCGWDFQPTRPFLKQTSVSVIGNLK